MLGIAYDICRFTASEKDGVYDRHRDIIKKLKFVSMLKPGERINVHTCSVVPNTIFTSIYRSIFKEGRQTTFLFLNNIMERSFELVALYRENSRMSDKISCIQIIADHRTNSVKTVISRNYLGRETFFFQHIYLRIGVLF